jgi:hypothetical protein
VIFKSKIFLENPFKKLKMPIIEMGKWFEGSDIKI